MSLSVVDLKLIEIISKKYFPQVRFDFIGKVKWNKPTDRERKRHFIKFQKELKRQRIKFTITHEFPVANSDKEISKWSSRNKFFISEIEDDLSFYCFVDISVGGKSGSITRYKFNIPFDFVNNKLLHDKIEMIKTTKILIR